MESNDRFGRCQAESNTITPALAFDKRTGIDAEVKTGISLSIHIVQSQFCIIVADFTCQRTTEHHLGILGTVDDTALQLHAGCILADGKENGIQLQGVHTQTMDGGASIDTASGRSAEAECEVVERNVLRCQEVADGILLTRLQLHTRRG